MTLQQKNKVFFTKSLDDVFNKKDIASADRNYAADYILHNETVAAMARAQGQSPVEGMKRFFRDFFIAFPDYTVSIEYIGAEDDKVFAI
jgi:predicted SnoaL-like aldol condensation-catalyzing enzyme